MATKEQRDLYADEFAARFEALTRWAIENWPNEEAPLSSSEFSGIRKEIGLILGSRLNETKKGQANTSKNEQSQYVHVNPAPWP